MPFGVLAILGFAVGAMVLSGRTGRGMSPRAATERSLRDRAIAAQVESARASQYARDLAAQYSRETRETT